MRLRFTRLSNLTVLVSGVDAQLGGTTESLVVVTPDNVTEDYQQGTALYCYECQDPGPVNISNSPCYNQLATITIRQCSQADRYCQVCRRPYYSLYTACNDQLGQVG